MRNDDRQIIDGNNSGLGGNGSGAAVMIGATGIANGTSGIVPQPMAGDQGKFLRGSGDWVTVGGGGDMLGANDLSDVASASTSRTNLGLGTMATQASSNVSITGGSITLLDANFTLQDNSDATKQAKFELSGITTGTTRTLTVPNASTSLVGTDVAQTLSNKTLTDISNVFDVRDTNFTISGSTSSRKVQFNPDTIAAATTVVIDIPNINGQMTVQGNTFNGASQLVQLNGSGKLAASTVSTTNNSLIKRDNSGLLTDTRTGTDAVEIGDSGYFWHKLPGYFRVGVDGSTASFFQVGNGNGDQWKTDDSQGIYINAEGASTRPTQMGNTTGNLTLKGATLQLDATTFRLNLSTNATGDIYYRNGSNTDRLPIGSSGHVLTVASGVPSWTAPAGVAWTEVTGTSASAAVNNGYIANNAALVSVSLPASAAIGQVVRIAGKGAGGWRVTQGAGQTIHFGATDSTTGASGYIESTNRYDTVELLCTITNSDYTVISVQGTLNVN